ncbi:hypothetical protein IJ425_00120 [bacterium]|nr:hypothetical protein [bacterium]
MGLSASQGRMLLLTARKSDLEYRAQQISQKRLVLSQQLEEIAMDYEEATSDRKMSIYTYQYGAGIDPEDAAKRSENLTYKSLISGTVTAVPSSHSGIQGASSIGTTSANYGYTSTNAYRLVSATGAIVVASIDEIPMTIAKETETKPTGTKVGDADGSATKYETKKEKSDGTEEISVSFVPAEGTALAGLLTENKKTLSIEYDKDSNIMRVKGEDGNYTYYSLANGATTEATGSYTWENATLYQSDKQVPMSTESNETDVVDHTLTGHQDGYEGYELVKGKDGVYSIMKNGAVVSRYLVDEALKYGSTDGSGGTDGPNYLQDCLRNGKYLIQQYSVDENKDDGYRWSNISWDATANISDAYYTENDDAAKAKYDRLQNQIQAQDKKLEIELDNVETQRSAVTTEQESVKKVIDDNIKNSFNAFA